MSGGPLGRLPKKLLASDLLADDKLPRVRPAIFLAIQIVEVCHGKAHRGAAGARTRAELPLALPLPIVGDHGVLHHCTLHGWDGFIPRHVAAAPRLRGGAVNLCNRWRVEPRADAITLHAHPDPRVGTRALLAAPHDRWARMRWNGREHGYEGSWYRQITLSFGGFSEAPAVDVFLGEPDVTLDLRRDLLRLGRRRVTAHVRPAGRQGR